MKNSRNEHGVKFSSDCWRTVGGVLYPHWSTVCTEGQVAKLRAGGARVRRFGVEIYIHPDDTKLAWQIEAEA